MREFAAVHLQLIESLTVEWIIFFPFFMCMQRIVISDNAKAYKPATKEIRKLIRSPRLKEYFKTKTVEGKFIMEFALF